MESNQSHQWQTLSQFLEIRSPWLNLIGEKVQNDQQQILDYWRVEKADSVVIITIQNGQFILPKPIYRHGLKQITLDFPGGRVLSQQTVAVSAVEIIKRELGITESSIVALNSLNVSGWAINSSFSNQKLYGFAAEISPNISIPSQLFGFSYPTTSQGVKDLLNNLICLQCRGVLLQWWQSQSL